MSARRSTTAKPASEHSELAERAWTWLQGWVALLLVMTPLVPTEAVGQGATVLLSLAWTLALLTAWGAARYGARPLSFDLVDGLILALAAWIVITMLVAGPRANPRATLHAGWHWVSLLASVWLVRHVMTTALQRRTLIAIMLAVATGLAVHGLLQFAVVMPHHRDSYFPVTEPRKQLILQENGIDPAPDSAQRFQFENRLRSTEPYATFALANSLAGFLAAWLVMGLALGTQRKRGEGSAEAAPSPAVLAARWATMAALALCLVLTKSRAGWIACAGGMAVLIWWERRRLREHLRLVVVGTVVLLAAVVTGILVGTLDRQIITEAWLSLTYRAQYWQAAAALIGDRPLFGSGPGNFQDFYARYKLPQASEMVADPHNFLLEIAATLGLPGLILFTGLLAVLVRATVLSGGETADAAPKNSDGRQGGERALLIGSLLGIVLAAAYGWLVDLPPELFPGLGLPLIWLVVLPISGLSYVVWRSWVLDGTCPSHLMLLSWGVLAVNLLAAGGIGFGGVAQSFWLLPALGSAVLASRGEVARLGPRGVAAGLLVSLALVFGCVYTEYLPAIRGHSLLLRAQAERDPEQARRLLLSAARVDPWQAEPWRQLASMELSRWLASGSDDSREAWTSAVEQMRARDQASQAAASHEGQLWLRAYRARGELRDLEQALTAFQRAAELYPNGHAIHAQVAWVAHLAGQQELARSHAERALALNERNPHWEQKLERRPVEDPGPEPDQTQQTPPPDLNAEQLMQQLRKATR